MLYEVAITQLPTKNEAENGVGEKIVLQTNDFALLIPADSENTAGAVAMTNVDKEKVAFGRLKVYVRPFAENG